jgi:hypothetical protein
MRSIRATVAPRCREPRPLASRESEPDGGAQACCPLDRAAGYSWPRRLSWGTAAARAGVGIREKMLGPEHPDAGTRKGLAQTIPQRSPSAPI